MHFVSFFSYCVAKCGLKRIHCCVLIAVPFASEAAASLSPSLSHPPTSEVQGQTVRRNQQGRLQVV